MADFLFSLGIFIVIYLFYLITVISRKKQLDKFMSGVEVNYLKRKYKLSLKKIKPKKIANLVALVNSFIISLIAFLVIFIDNYILKIMVAFVLSVPLIIIFYHIIGITLKRKEG